MIRLSALFWLGLVGASGFATYSVKYAVQGVDDQLRQVRQQTAAEQQEIRVLKAEWTYVNQPERLADLNQRFLHLAPVTAKQLQQTIDDIPLRPPEAPPAPAAPAAPVIAAASPSTAAPATEDTLAPGLVIGADPAVAAATGPADVADSPTPKAGTLPVALAAFHPAAAAPGGSPERVAAVAPVAGPASLDALFAQVAEKER
jgi:hypothetical protein